MSLITWSDATTRMAHFVLFPTRGDAKLVRKIEDKGGQPRSPQSHRKEGADNARPDNRITIMSSDMSAAFPTLRRITV